MSLVTERDFPKGHPKACDYVPDSPEAIEWARKNIHPLGERAYPVGSIKSSDTPDNECSIVWEMGVDPHNPHLEAFTGATPEVAAARKVYERQLSAVAKETPMHPEGFVDTAAIAHQTALDFLMAQGHDEAAAQKILAEQGLDQVLAAKQTLGVKG